MLLKIYPIFGQGFNILSKISSMTMYFLNLTFFEIVRLNLHSNHFSVIDIILLNFCLTSKLTENTRCATMNINLHLS